MPLDYSRWNNIEISDDEDDTHPNVDTASLFRWRHRAREEKMAEHNKQKNELVEKIDNTKHKVEDLKKSVDFNDKKKQLDELEGNLKKLLDEEDELKKKESRMAWNVDTISTPKYCKTVINKSAYEEPQVKLSEEEEAEAYLKFVKNNEQKLKEFAFLRRFNDSYAFFLENRKLVCENTSNYLLLEALELEMSGQNELMKRVAHQAVIMRFMLELAKQAKKSPQICVEPFFRKIKESEPLANKESESYMKAFYAEVKAFQTRIENRAKEKLELLGREALEKEREEKKNDPNYLDPQVVFDTLPENLQKCFFEQDTVLLNEELQKIDPRWGMYYMNRCVKSGLWNPENAELFVSLPVDMPTPDEDKDGKYKEYMDEFEKPELKKVE